MMHGAGTGRQWKEVRWVWPSMSEAVMLWFGLKLGSAVGFFSLELQKVSGGWLEV